jgi:hypothetical protein
MPRRTSSAVSYSSPHGSGKAGSFWRLALKVVWQITLAPLARQVAPGRGSGTRVVGSTRSPADAGALPSTRPAHDIANVMTAARIRIAASAEHPQARNSFRPHEILLPQGFHSEIRLALRDHGRLWGALVLFREDPHRLFDDHDTAAVCAVAEH